MALERKTRLEAIEIAEGVMFIQLQKMTLRAGAVVEAGPHRTSVPIDGGDAAQQIAAVNAHLGTMGFAAPPTDELALVETAFAAIAAMPAVIPTSDGKLARLTAIHIADDGTIVPQISVTVYDAGIKIAEGRMPRFEARPGDDIDAVVAAVDDVLTTEFHRSEVAAELQALRQVILSKVPDVDVSNALDDAWLVLEQQSVVTEAGLIALQDAVNAAVAARDQASVTLPDAPPPIRAEEAAFLRTVSQAIHTPERIAGREAEDGEAAARAERRRLAREAEKAAARGAIVIA